VTGEIALRFEKQQASRLKQLGYRRHPKGAGWIRSVQRAWFPRYHLYSTIDWQAKHIRLDLHLDHEREDLDSFTPTSASDGAAVTAELQRILRTFVDTTSGPTEPQRPGKIRRSRRVRP